jgi:hypothetical protein
MMIVYGSVCAALIRLRSTQPLARAIRIPAGGLLAVAGIGTSVFLLAQLDASQISLMGLTAMLAGLNWAWSTRLARRSAPADPT